eukprot:16229822-Heterocapsa_arctica.AAC.1
MGCFSNSDGSSASTAHSPPHVFCFLKPVRNLRTSSWDNDEWSRTFISPDPSGNVYFLVSPGVFYPVSPSL